MLGRNGAAGEPPEEYEDEKGGGIGIGIVSPVCGASSGGRGLEVPIGVNPGGKFPFGRYSKMCCGITGELGTVGTSGGFGSARLDDERSTDGRGLLA
jgi:hypothetical protein